jgi:hypothetical protein
VLAFDEGRPTAFVKVGPPASIGWEATVLRLVHEGRPTTFRYPVVAGHGSLGSMWYLAMSPILDGVHLPAKRPPLDEILAEVREVLRPLPRRDDLPHHWVPIHGDFTPWNLRRTRRGLTLFDWEFAGWGPEEADEVLFVESAIYLGQRVRRRAWSIEAAEFWLGGGQPEPRVRSQIERYVRSTKTPS